MTDGTLEFGDVNPLAAKIRKAIGAGPFEEVQVRTPQFDRADGKEITVFPKGAAFLDALKTAPRDILNDIGLRRWDEEEPVLYLFPCEWYDDIPEGYEIESISGRKEPFKKGKTSNDRRFGMLAYGITNTLARQKEAQRGE